MKDELREFEMDESTRKTATDWLMHVISGKRANGNGNGSGHSEDSDSSGGAVAVAEMPDTEMPRAQETAEAFTAEDLCGAPAVPLIKVAPKDEITADDVCWVPEDMRLKPQPPVEEKPSASNLHVMPTPGGREELDILRSADPRDLELTYLTGGEQMVTASDISRDPAPYMVEPTWNGMGSGPEMREITAADIMRESVRNYIPEPSGFDMPTSFRVMRSAAPPPMAEAAAPTIEAAAPVLEAAPAIETAAAAPEPQVTEAISAIKAAAPVVNTPLPVVEAPVEGIDTQGSGAAVPAVEESAPAVEAAAPEAEAVAPVIEVPDAPVESSAPEVELGEAEVSAEEEDEADAHEIEEALEHPEDLSGQEFLSAPEPEPEFAAATQQEIEGEGGVKAGENVFAREGFWGSGEGNDVEEGSSKAISRGVKRAYTATPDSAEFAKHPEGWFSAWKTMLRLGSVLPWVARALPALESGALGVEPGVTSPAGTPGATGVAQETRQDVAGLRLVQYEIRTTVQDHSMQLKRMEEQLTRVRESVDSRSSENAEVAENLRAMTKLMRLAGIGLGALLLVLIVLVIVMLAHR